MTTKSTTKNFLYRVLCGFLFGVSVIVPGVSGSVMAVVMGIYNDLINIVSNPFKNLKKNFFFLLPIGIGALLGVGLFINILEWMFANYKVPSFLLFIGLIGGSVPSVLKEARKGGFKKKYLIGTVLAFAFALSIGIIKLNGGTLDGGMPQNILFPLSGAVAGISSMIPGMSISMILMLFGVYEPMLAATKNIDIPTMLPVAICFAAGMVLFSNITKHVFKKYRGLGYSMVAGFMSGSLVTIIITNLSFPEGVLGYVLSIIAIAAGIYIATLFTKLGERFGTNED